jgi:histidine phosphotransferase ChpT
MRVNVDLRVLELLASRVCHDLISPIGAIGNGLELIEEGGDAEMTGEALKLSVNCVRRASAILEFFRMAYGAAGSGGALTWDGARGLAAGLVEGSRVTLGWTPPPAGLTLPAGTAKLALNMALLAAEMLPRGGEVRVSLEPAPGRLNLVVTATGQDAKVPAETAAVLAAAGGADAAGLTAKTVHGYFTGRLAEAFGGRLELAALPPSSVRLTAGLPLG